MKLRNANGDYSIGLDMGTGSVGWAAVDGRGQLTTAPKGKPAWGSRLFDSAETAAAARLPRSQRRRYVRRRWRLDLLQSLFDDVVSQTDPEFFTRLRQSRLLPEDREGGHGDYRWPLFNDSDFTERDYYDRFPTIYHLRTWLMETDEKADIRLIYLALHNIVKHRGNFLREDDSKLSAKHADPEEALRSLKTALDDWCGEREDASAAVQPAKILEMLKDEDMRPSDKKKAIAPLIGVQFDDAAESKKCNEALAAAMLGLKAEFKNVFGEMSGAEQTSISLSNDEAVDALREVVPDEGVELFDALCAAHSAYVLQGLLSYAPGKTISANMVAKYEKYGDDLRALKALVKEYAPASYDSFFRGAQYPADKRIPGKTMYDPAKAQGYTKYNLGQSKLSYDDFAKAVQKLFADTKALDDPRCQEMVEGFDRQQFLRRLKTSDNGSIYYQLHLEELKAILDNQGRFYPFLKEDAEKLESLVSFRIPYYVGPLTQRNARLDSHEKPRFAWSERKAGKENVPITPWNWDQVIDKNKSAENFIRRMTGMCSYLQGEEVLPKCSLLYEEFCVLNELNGAKWTEDGDHEQRFDAADREGIVRDLFMRYKSVSYKRVEDWLVQNGEAIHPHVASGQGERGFESKLGSYFFFCHDVFGVDHLDEADYPMIEEIILWNTLFEDRKILKEKLEEGYGDRLSDTQIKKICKKRFTGWGRLSKKFLTGLKVETNGGRKSIMDVLREGDPNSDTRRGRALVLMEALRDENLDFQGEVDKYNKAYFQKNADALGINELPGSPAIRRSLNQAIRIVDEIAKTARKAPTNIFIEVTREDEDPKKKGKRTKRRYDDLKEALAAFKNEDKELWNQLCEKAPSDFDERLTLYFRQRGKCLYSGRPIDINRLSDSGLYEVDHIIPRAYVKDDSFENKALVYREENQRKTDELLLDRSIRQKMAPYWRMLHDARLIGDKKFNNLMRNHIDEKAMRGFIARQLVETSQMVKLVQALLAAKYPDTRIVPIKASVSHDLREAAGFVKCREANDYHHAHDALLACRIGLFVQLRHGDFYDNPVRAAHVIKTYVRSQSEEFRKTHRMPGSSGFIVNSFMTSGFDKETGEVFRDAWDAEAEVEGIRRMLNYRDCFITRMPVEDTGTFWDATIYSPRSGKNVSLPLKQGLDPKKYGSYSREQFAYFFVYEARDVKKGKTVFQFSQVPVYLAAKIRSDEGALEQYARELAEDAGLEFVRIERAKIMKKQLVEIDGDRLFISGLREVRNATEIAFSQREVELLSQMVLSEKPIEQADVLNLYASVGSTKSKLGVHLFAQLRLDRYHEAYLRLSLQDQIKMLLGLVAVINGMTNVVDLSQVGGGKYSGQMRISHSGLLSNPNNSYYIIDQSVTGMFERRTKIGL